MGKSKNTQTASMDLWKKMQPADHYHRLVSSADREAWEHLAALIYTLLVRHFHKPIIQKRAISVEDQVQYTLLHILNKIRKNQFSIDNPNKFYGSLKTIVIRCLVDVIRKPWPDDRATTIDEVIISLTSPQNRKNFAEDLLGLTSPQNTEHSAEDRLLNEQIWLALLQDADMTKEERLAVKLSWLMNKGLIDIKDNTALASRLSLELGQEVTYQVASTWVHEGKEKLQAYLENKWLPKKGGR